jgi:hypothetical protein
LRRAWFTFGVLCLSTVPASEVETVETPYVPDEHELEIFVGGRVGYLEVEDVDKGSPIVGFVYGLQPHRHLAFKGTLDYHSANFSREERRTFALTASVEVYPLSYWLPVRPHVLAGVGVYVSEVRRFNEFGDVLFDDTASDGGYHAGIGLDIDCCWLESGTRAIINLEARWMFTQEEEGTLEVRPDGVQYTAGVKFQF